MYIYVILYLKMDLYAYDSGVPEIESKNYVYHICYSKEEAHKFLSYADMLVRPYLSIDGPHWVDL